MAEHVNIHGRRRGRGVRPWLLIDKLIGLCAFIGGLASLAVRGLLGPLPDAQNEWLLLKESMRAVFFPVALAGLFLALLAGLCLWLQMPRVFLRMRWFKIKIIALIILIPALHLLGRSRVLLLNHAIDESRLIDAARWWRQAALVYLLAFCLMVVIACIGRIKPRFGQPIGPPGANEDRPAA